MRVTGVVALLAAFAIAGLAAARATPSSWGFVGPTLTHPAPPPDFALRDQDGQLLRLSKLHGKVVLVTFLYTHCPDLCPLTASNINAAMRLVGPVRTRVVVLSVSVDPTGDTRRAVKAFIRQHALLPQFHYLTGSKTTLTPVWRAYHVQPVKRGGPDVDHTLYTLVVDRSGRGRVLFDSMAQATAIAHDVRLLLR